MASKDEPTALLDLDNLGNLLNTCFPEAVKAFIDEIISWEVFDILSLIWSPEAFMLPRDEPIALSDLGICIL